MHRQYPTASGRRRYHFLWAFWRALAGLLAGYLVIFAFSLLIRPVLVANLIEGMRTILVRNVTRYTERIVSGLLGFDAFGSPMEQFLDLLVTHGGLPLLVFLSVAGLLAIALEWRYGALLS